MTCRDKIARAGLHPIRSDFVDAPLFEELPLTLECQVVELTEEGPAGCASWAVLNMSADESILGERRWWTQTRPTSSPLTGCAGCTAS